MTQEEIVKDSRVIHFAWARYDPDVVVPLVPKIVEFNKRTYDYDTNMGLYLLSEPSEKGEGRALYVGRLRNRSRLYGGNYRLVDDDGRLLGVVTYVKAVGNVQPAK